MPPRQVISTVSLGGDGKVRTSFCYHGGHFASVAIDSHHRIVTAGSGCLVRTLPSGRADYAFNRANWISNRSLAFDRGRIVVAGDYGRHEVFALARNKPDGRVDHSFDRDGRRRTSATPTPVPTG